jgi:hypothetical protein
MKIKHMPAEELVILEMVEYSLQKIAETGVLIQNSGHAIILNLADGIVFHHSPLPFNSKSSSPEERWTDLLGHCHLRPPAGVLGKAERGGKGHTGRGDSQPVAENGSLMDKEAYGEG